MVTSILVRVSESWTRIRLVVSLKRSGWFEVPARITSSSDNDYQVTVAVLASNSRESWSLSGSLSGCESRKIVWATQLFFINLFNKNTQHYNCNKSIIHTLRIKYMVQNEWNIYYCIYNMNHFIYIM